MISKTMWNAVMHSREVWPVEHPFHELDLIATGILVALAGIAYITMYERWFSRTSRQMQHEEDEQC